MNTGKKYFPLVLVVIGLALYSPALPGPFVLDDLLYVVFNPDIRVFANFMDLSPTRYLTYLSLAVNYHLSGLNPFDFRLVNVIIHLINASLVFWLARAVFRAMEGPEPGRGVPGAGGTPVFLAAAGASLLFLVHPVQTQAVSYIAQRSTSLATLLYLATILLYMKYRLGGTSRAAAKGAIYIASLVLAVMAQKTKEIAFTLPFMLTLFEFSFFAGAGSVGKRLKGLLPFFFTLLIIPVSLFSPAGGGGGAEGAGGAGGAEALMRSMKISELTTLSPYEYLATQMRVVVEYLRLLVWPSGLHFDYAFPLSSSFAEPGVLLSAISLCAILAGAAYLFKIAYGPGPDARTLRVVSAGVLWFFIALSVESSVIPINDVISEHRLYLPSAGLFISLAALVLYLSERAAANSTRLCAYAVLGVLGAMVLALAPATYLRNAVWSDDLLLYQSEVAMNPEEAPPHNYLAMAYQRRGMLEEAADEYMLAVEITPGFAAARKNLGVVYFRLGELDLALEEFAALKAIMPGYAGAYYNAGLVYLARGMRKEAREEFLEVLRLRPGDESARKILEEI